MMTDLDIMARTLYGEGRGDYARLEGGLSSLIGIANVIMNRVNNQSWYGKTIRDVCLKPYQFSCWNPTDPNRDVIATVTPASSPIFDQCLLVADSVSKGLWPDLTKGADHYYALWLPRAPHWACQHKPVSKIGHHVFYKLSNTKEKRTR